MRPLTPTLALAAALALTAPAANADECYTRTYDRAHLARHPDQRVTSVRLRVTHSPDWLKVWFKVWFTLRGGNEPVKSEGVCLEGGHCYVECDGGGLDFQQAAGGLIMRLDHIRVAKCGQDLTDVGRSPEVTGGVDDRVFRLDRSPCEGQW